MTGNAPPATEKALPDIVSELIVNATVPDEVKVSILVEMLSTVTLPKLRELVLSVNAGVAAVVPEPLRETLAVLPVAELLEIVIAPVAAPTAAGSKLTCNVAD